MSVVVHDQNAAGAAGSHLPRRPGWLLSVLLDGALSIAAYLASYLLRFQGARLEIFLPGAWSTLPAVVAGQLIALVLAGAYVPRPRIDWLIRVVIGVASGSAVATALLGLTIGFAGLSRTAFIADAMLLAIAALAWRGAWVLSTRRPARTAGLGPDDLIDRAEETTTIGSMVTSLYRYRELLRNLVMKDLKLKYRGSVFGFLWSLANPLLMIVVYTVAFTYILRVRSEGFIFYLMLGLFSWTFFASSASMSTGSMVDNAGLLKSVFFPRAILPIATVLFNLAQYVLTMLVFLPLMLAWYRVPLAAPMMLFPVILVMQALFTIGVAMMLATATTFFRDVRHLLEVALAVLFWTTPILYELDKIPDRWRLIVLMSPMSPFVVAYQKIFYFSQWPEPTVWLMAGTYAAGAFIIGTTLVLAFQDRFAEQL
ncbi:MAG: ABC transporter permease [Acidobacteriota bacterium]